MPPREVLEAVKRFLMDEGLFHPPWLESESDTHLTFGTFRGNLAVAAFPDPKGEAPTRVRITTLREEGIVPPLVTYLRTLEH